MLWRALSRILASVATLLIVIALSFFLMRLAPGGPFDSERPLDPEIAKNLRHIYRLDLPLSRQFLVYLQSLAHGDFGPEPALARLFRERASSPTPCRSRCGSAPRR